MSGLIFGGLCVILLISCVVTLSGQNDIQTNPEQRNDHLTTGRYLSQYPTPTNPSYTPCSLAQVHLGVHVDVTPSAPPLPLANASPYASPSAPLCPPANTTSYGSTYEEPPPYEAIVAGVQSPPQQEPSSKNHNESKPDMNAL